MNEVRKKVLSMSDAEIAALYKTIFSSPEGQLILEDMKDRFFWYVPFPLGEQGQRAEGMRGVIMTIERNRDYTPEDETLKKETEERI